ALALALADDVAVLELQAASTGPAASRPAPAALRQSRSRRVRPGPRRAGPDGQAAGRISLVPG
ncbi:MAG: hypothetical protein ACHQCE_22135, partial [Streptosporangiales bacterium]